MHAEKYYELQVAYACWVETLKEGNCTNTCIILLFPSRQNTVNLTQETVSNAHGHLTETTIAAPIEVGWQQQADRQTNKRFTSLCFLVFLFQLWLHGTITRELDETEELTEPHTPECFALASLAFSFACVNMESVNSPTNKQTHKQTNGRKKEQTSQKTCAKIYHYR